MKSLIIGTLIVVAFTVSLAIYIGDKEKSRSEDVARECIKNQPFSQCLAQCSQAPRPQLCIQTASVLYLEKPQKGN